MRERGGPYLLLIPAGTIFGVLFVLSVYYFPHGIVGQLRARTASGKKA